MSTSNKSGHMLFIWRRTNLETTNLACKYGHQCSRFVINYKRYTCIGLTQDYIKCILLKEIGEPHPLSTKCFSFNIFEVSTNDPTSNLNENRVTPWAFYNELHWCYEKWLHKKQHLLLISTHVPYWGTE